MMQSCNNLQGVLSDEHGNICSIKSKGSNVDKDSLEALLAEGLSIERIARRFGKHPSTVSYWVKKHGLRSGYSDKHAAKGAIERERLEELIEDGMTIAEIASGVERSKGAVRHWLRVYALRTKHERGSRYGTARRAAHAAGLLVVKLDCRKHGETEFILEGRGSYRCKQCRTERVVRHRQRLKQTLVTEAGGRCVICGYDRELGALQFHHLDPSEKRFQISRFGITYGLEQARAEARKCVLLCGNCHAEVENGVALVPLEFVLDGHLRPIHHNLG